MHSRSCLVPLLLLCVVGCVGCGSSGGSATQTRPAISDSAEIRVVVSTYLVAVNTNNAQATCANEDVSMQRQGELGSQQSAKKITESCAANDTKLYASEGTSQNTSPGRVASEVSRATVAVHGNRATATYDVPWQKATISLVKVNGRWLVDYVS